MLSTVDFFEYKLALNPFPIPMDQQPTVTINTINQYSYCVAEMDDEFKQVLKESDILLPDGIGVTKAYEFLTGNFIQKIAGADMHTYLLEALNGRAGKCFYLGSTEETLTKIRLRAEVDYPFIQTGSYSPPFKPTFSDADISRMVDLINAFKPNVLFIGLTAPKQEKLAYLLKDRIDATVICSVGAVFDFYAGTVNRPSQFWIDMKLEWFIRMLKEPGRMWKRYLLYGTKFAYWMISAKINTNA